MWRALAVLFVVSAVCALALVVFTRISTSDPAVRRSSATASTSLALRQEAGDDGAQIDDEGFALAVGFTAPIHDSTSLLELREAVEVRGRLGLAVLEAEVNGFKLGFRAQGSDCARRHAPPADRPAEHLRRKVCRRGQLVSQGAGRWRPPRSA